jgi:hypothetical protein
MPNLTVVTNAGRKFETVLDVERDFEKVVVFNGVPFPPQIPGWIVWFKLIGDPVEYNVRIDARCEREARSLALITLSRAGVDISETNGRAA